MKIKGSRKQRGAVVLLVTMVLPVLLLAAGFALDFGHVFVNKTRLQNALDATALSAAIAINSDAAKDTAAATAKGITTFNLFKAASGNDELAGLAAGSLVFEYSNTLNPWGSFNSATDTFAFVRVTSTNMLQVTPVLIRISNKLSGDIPIPAKATAGPVGNNCTVMPFLLCADKAAPCNNLTCYGYNIGQIYSLDEGTKGKYTAGNYGLLRLTGSGAHQIELDLEGKAVNTCPPNTPNNYWETQPGVDWGGVRPGINYRIDTLDTNNSDYFTPASYDDYLKAGGKKIKSYIITMHPYADYLEAGGNKQRVMAVAVGDCTDMKPGHTTIPKEGTGCVFITRHAAQGNPQTVDVEFIGSCQQNGVWDPNNAVLYGPYKIVLFKSPGSGDS